MMKTGGYYKVSSYIHYSSGLKTLASIFGENPILSVSVCRIILRIKPVFSKVVQIESWIVKTGTC